MRRRLRRAVPVLAAIVGVATLAACSVLGPRPDTARYFLLRPLAEPTGSPSLEGLVLGLGPVTVPDYLDRMEMLDLVGPYELRYAPGARWVEPLGDQLREVLRDNLQVMLRPEAVVPWPWFEGDGVALQLEVAFGPIRLAADGTWTGAAEWTLRDAVGREALERARFTFELGRDSVPPEVLPERLSAELRRLSGSLAESVRRHTPR